MNRAVWLSGLLMAAGCSSHSLEEGTYAFTAGSHATTDDPCQLAPDGGSLWTAIVATSGEVVTLAYLIDGVQPGIRVQGLYKSQVFGKPDAFNVDGTGHDVTAELGDTDGGAFDCVADFLQVHVDANIDSATQFSGALTVSYTLTSTGTLQTGCPQNPTCTLRTPFTAVKTGP